MTKVLREAWWGLVWALLISATGIGLLMTGEKVSAFRYEGF